MLPENPRFQPRISTNQTFPPPRIIPDNFPSDSGPKSIPLQYRSRSKHQSLENAITGCPNTASLEGKKKKKKILGKKKEKNFTETISGKNPATSRHGRGEGPVELSLLSWLSG